MLSLPGSLPRSTSRIAVSSSVPHGTGHPPTVTEFIFVYYRFIFLSDLLVARPVLVFFYL